jgi:hypothetical protein
MLVQTAKPFIFFFINNIHNWIITFRTTQHHYETKLCILLNTPIYCEVLLFKILWSIQCILMKYLTYIINNS